jgi:pimeloyl-ACP methyl ester carboxylesterase
MPTLRRDDLGLHFEVSGDGLPILLTHGFSATSAMFSGTARALLSDYRVVTWDLRGHGSSDSPDDPSLYSSELVMSDMIALLDHLDIERAVVAGHSIGGFLTLKFAVTHPERVSALVLEDTGPGYRSDEAREHWNTSVVEAYATVLSERGLAGLPVGAELHGDAHRDAVGLIHAARGILVQRDAHVLEALPSIAVPTLVIVGENDTAFVPGSKYMAEKIPGAHLVEIPGAGHAPNLSHPELFDQCLRTFLDDVAANENL